MWSEVYHPPQMDHRVPNLPGRSNDSSSHRRARAYSQPIVTPGAGPSHRTLDTPFQQPQHTDPGPSAGFPPLGSYYDEDALFQSLLAMSEDHQGSQGQFYPPPSLLSQLPQLPPMPPTTPLPPQIQNQLANPLLSQAFLAWLQYMQLQMQLQQPQPEQQQFQQPPMQFQQPPAPVQTQHAHAPAVNSTFAVPRSHIATQVPFPVNPTPTASPSTPDRAGTGRSSQTNTPSPDADAPEAQDTPAIAEEKRRRNTAASARFRIKKKQWTLNLERSITDLSGRVEELEREAAELRRENGWLKEIVMLKSKRFGGPAPQLSSHPLQSGTAPQVPEQDSGRGDSTESSERDEGDNEQTEGTNSGKGKEVAR